MKGYVLIEAPIFTSENTVNMTREDLISALNAYAWPMASEETKERARAALRKKQTDG